MLDRDAVQGSLFLVLDLIVFLPLLPLIIDKIILLCRCCNERPINLGILAMMAKQELNDNKGKFHLSFLY